MALIVKDRVQETTTTTGTGAVSLLGAVSGYQSFGAIGNANTTYYCIAGQTTSEWEVGIGTYTAAGASLSRDTVLSSSNSGSLVAFSAGTKSVFVTYPSTYTVNSQTGTAANATTAAACTGNSATATTAAACSGNSATATTATTATTANALNTANNYQVSSLGVGAAANGTAGDITASRSGGTTGVIFFGTAGNRYLYYDGTTYQMPTASLVVGGNVTAYSDERVKTNWRDLQPDFIERLAKVKHGIYDRTDTEATQVGVTAQSLRFVMEHAVMENENGDLSVAYGNAALVACVKLAQRVVELEAKLDQLIKDKS
jgi:hypothetical protein